MTLRAFVLLGGLLLGLACSGPASSADNWGPFRGQFVDVETGQPIPGVAVLVTWWQNVPNPVQGQERFYDAREAVSDAEGRFEMARRRPPLLSVPGFDILPYRITYFGPSYEPVGVVVTPADGEPFVAPTIVQMRRLKTRQELLEKRRSRPAGVPLEKMPELTKAVNEERRMLGFDRRPVGRSGE